MIRLLLLALALSAVAPASAQNHRVTAEENDAEREPEGAARLRLADSYLRVGQYERAITLLEELREVDPSSRPVFDRLRQAYESVKRYDDALALIDSYLATAPDDELRARRAAVLYAAGREADSFAAWDALADDAEREKDLGLFGVLYRMQFEQRLFGRAIAVLERSQASVAPTAFMHDLAYLYSLNGQHAEAAQTYVRMLEGEPRQQQFVRQRLQRFTEQPEAVNTTVTVFEEAVRAKPLERPIRELLGWLYAEQGEYSKALDATRAIDRLEGEQGQALYQFAERAQSAGAFDQAAAAYAEILTRYPDSPAAPEALAGRGILLQLWADADTISADSAQARYRRALGAYDQFLTRYPTHPATPNVLLQAARLQLDHLDDPPAADSLLTLLTARYPNAPAADDAAFERGRIAILDGRLDDASLAFAGLEDRLRVGDLAERARLERAQIHFYRGEFESALTLAEILTDNTSNDTANDAIALTLLLTENEGPDSLNTPLRRFSSASLLARQGQRLASLDALDAISADFPTHALVDEMAMLRADALRGLNRMDEAAAVLASLVADTPNSYLADRAVLALADVQLAQGDKDAALVTLARLLTDYPGSLLVPDVRQRIRRIRGDAPL